MDINTVIIKRAVQGDESAFRDIYDSLAGKMYSLCLRYAAVTEDANDLFQEGFIKLHRHLESFRNEGSFEGWARRIFVTTCLDAIKGKRVKFENVEDHLNGEFEVNNGENKLSMDYLLNVIQQLPDSYRTIVNLYVIEDYSHKEISDMLEISENASKSKLHKARNYLKQLWKQQAVGQFN